MDMILTSSVAYPVVTASITSAAWARLGRPRSLALAPAPVRPRCFAGGPLESVPAG